MIDPESILAVLEKLFPGAAPAQIAAAGDDVVGLGERWEELPIDPGALGYNFSVQCPDICALAEQLEPGDEVVLRGEQSRLVRCDARS